MQRPKIHLSSLIRLFYHGFKFLVLERLTNSNLENIFERAESLLGSKINLELDAKNELFKQADGDGRTFTKFN